MATISCKCDTCKRQIELSENTHGLSIIGRCTITSGCRGKLYQLDRNPNTVRGANLPVLSGMDNYIPRQTFHQHTQTLPSSKWRVTHKLGIFPSVLLYSIDNNGQYVLVNKKEYIIDVIDENSIYVTFEEDRVGIIHCISRSSVPVSTKQMDLPENSTQLSTKGVLTLAVPRYLTRPSVPSDLYRSFPIDLCWDESKIRIEVEVTFPNEEPIVCLDTLDNIVNINSPWAGWSSILIEGRRNYCLKSLDISKLRTFVNGSYHIDDIPNGTKVKILRIDYGSGTPQKVYSRGLLGMVSDKPFDYIDKRLDRIVDVGEMVGDDGHFTYIDGDFHLDNKFVEIVYPKTGKATAVVVPPKPSPTPTPTVTSSVPPTPAVTSTPTATATVTRTPMMTMPVTPTVTPTISITPSVTPSVTPTPSTIIWVIDGEGFNRESSSYEDSFMGGTFDINPYIGFDGGGFG